MSLRPPAFVDDKAFGWYGVVSKSEFPQNGNGCALVSLETKSQKGYPPLKERRVSSSQIGIHSGRSLKWSQLGRVLLEIRLELGLHETDDANLPPQKGSYPLWV